MCEAAKEQLLLFVSLPVLQFSTTCGVCSYSIHVSVPGHSTKSVCNPYGLCVSLKLVQKLVAYMMCRAVKKVQPVLGEFVKDDYKTERLWATASDGTQVPISLVYKKSLLQKNGSMPMLLDG